jgi:hypothetical protein
LSDFTLNVASHFDLLWYVIYRSVAGSKELHVLQITMKAMEDRRFDWNLVRLQIPRVEKQLPRTMSPLDIPVRHTQCDSLSSPGSHSDLTFLLKIMCVLMFLWNQNIVYKVFCNILMEGESADSVEECILKALDEEEQPLLRLEQPNGSALQNSKVCVSYDRTSNELPCKRSCKYNNGEAFHALFECT